MPNPSNIGIKKIQYPKSISRMEQIMTSINQDHRISFDSLCYLLENYNLTIFEGSSAFETSNGENMIRNVVLDDKVMDASISILEKLLSLQDGRSDAEI